MQGTLLTDIGCLFLRILLTLWTMEGTRSMSSALFRPPNPFLLISSMIVTLAFEMVPTIQATRRGLVCWKLLKLSFVWKFPQSFKVEFLSGTIFLTHYIVCLSTSFILNKSVESSFKIRIWFKGSQDPVYPVSQKLISETAQFIRKLIIECDKFKPYSISFLHPRLFPCCECGAAWPLLPWILQ